MNLLGTCFSVAVSRPIKDMSCLNEQVVLDRRELILEFRASHLWAQKFTIVNGVSILKVLTLRNRLKALRAKVGPHF